MKHAVFVLFYPDLIPRYRLMVRALKKNGWRITVITWKRGEVKAFSDDAVDAWYQVEVPADAATVSMLLRLPSLYREVVRIAKGLGVVDVVFLTHYFLLPLARRLPFEWRLRIYDAAEFYAMDLSLYFGFASGLTRPVLQVLEKRMVANCDGILTVDSCDSWFDRYYRGMGRPAQVLWNVPAMEDDPKEEEVCTAAAICDGRPAVVYVGALMHSKGLEVGIRAAEQVRKHFPEVLFLFVGPWLENPDTAQTLVRELDLEQHVRFLAPLPYRSMVALLHSARVGLLLLQRSHNYELVGAGNGRKLFAYMQASLPVVAPDFGEIGVLVKQLDCGVCVNTESSDAVAAAICTYLSEPENAKMDGARGRSAFVERFNWEVESRQFNDFVNGLDS